MLNKIKNTLAIGIVVSTTVLGLAGGQVYAASAKAANPTVDPRGQACAALEVASGDSACGGTAGAKVDSTIKLAINVLSLIVGIASVIMIIIGGFKYVLSQGEGANTASAKNTIIYALVGLVVVLLAQVIVKFVLTKTTTTASCKPPTTLKANGKCG